MPNSQLAYGGMVYLSLYCLGDGPTLKDYDLHNYGHKYKWLDFDCLKSLLTVVLVCLQLTQDIGLTMGISIA